MPDSRRGCERRRRSEAMGRPREVAMRPRRSLLVAALSCCAAILLGCLAPFASGYSFAESPRLDGHSSADFLRYLDQHVATYESTLEVTKDMYKRIGQLQQRAPSVEEGAPLRIHAEMSTPKMCPGPHCKEYKFLAEKLMPAALKEVTRRYKITRPTKGALRLPMQCKTTLPAGNCGEVMDLNDQPPLCRNPDLYAGYELCKTVDGNLHCVTMLGGSGFADTDFALMVGMDVEGPSEIPATNLNKDVFIPGVFDSIDELADKLIQDTYGNDKESEGTDGKKNKEEASDSEEKASKAKDNKDKDSERSIDDFDKRKTDRGSGEFQEVPDFFDFRLRRLASVDGEFDVRNMCKMQGMIAYSGQCGYDLESGRPLAGYVTFCPGSIDINGNLTDMLEDAVHQIVHALYMSGSLVRLYKTRDQSSTIQGQYRASVLQTPAVARAAQEHFGCTKIDSVELEEVPGADGLVTSHFSTRWLAGELMTPHLGPQPSTLSRFTAALAEDSGWYKYEHRIKTGVLKYGLNAGCDFLDAAKRCHKPENVRDSKIFCPEASERHRCVPDGLGHAPCGGVDGMPGCFSPAASGQIHSCLDPMSPSSARETMFGVYHGYKARCLEVEEPVTVSLGMMEETMEAGAKCFKFDCKDNQLFLVLGMHNVRCPTGERINVGDLDIDAGFQEGTLGPCPDNEMMCNSMKCPHDCSNNGVCNPLSSDGTCGCDLGFGFSRLDSPGAEDCSSSLLCSSDQSCAPLQCNSVNGACGFAIRDLPPSADNSILFSAGFTKSINGMFDAVDVYGTAAVPEQKMVQVAAMVMSLLDMDQDGQADDRKLIKELKKTKPSLFLYADKQDMNSLLSRQDVLARTKFEAAAANREEILASEIFIEPGPDDPPDEGLLAVLQLLFRHGWSQAYPTAEAQLIEAMDEASGDCGYRFCGGSGKDCEWRGDAKTGCTGIYHDGSDPSCGLSCLLPDYFALSVASAYGALDRPGACSAVSSIWSGCRKRDMERRNAKFFDAIEAYNPVSKSRRRQLLALSKGTGLINAPILPLGSVYRQYDAKTFALSQPLKHGAELDTDVELTISGADVDVSKMRKARAGSSSGNDDSSDSVASSKSDASSGSGATDASNSQDSSSDASDSSVADTSGSTFYGAVKSEDQATSFYSFYGYLATNRAYQQQKAKDEVVVFGNPKTAMGQTIDKEQTQTWEQLVLGLIASMEGRQEGNKEDTATAVEHTCVKDRFSQCCGVPNHLDAAMGCCSAEVDRCGVCNGGESSCALNVVLRIAARENLEVDVLVGRLKSELGLLLADFMITPDLIKVDLTSMEQVARRRLLSNGLGDEPAGAALNPGWVEVDLTLSVLPPDYNSNVEQPMVGLAADFLAKLDGSTLARQPEGLKILRATQSVVTGVCGNRICEWGEMLAPDGSPGSCPQDCPALPSASPHFALPGNATTDRNFTHTKVCPDVTAACSGGDPQACFEATMAATDLQCLGIDESAIPPADADLPPVSMATIAPCPFDRHGDCCMPPAALDASMACCHASSGVDACGVCAGERSTCATTALLRVAAPSSLEVKAFVGNVQEIVSGILIDEGVDASAVTVGVDSMVRLADSPTRCTGMLDGGRVLPPGVAAVNQRNDTVPKECTLPTEWLRLEFPVSVHPSLGTSAALKPAPSPEKITAIMERTIAATNFNGQQKLLILGLLETNATGVCGNNVCENGEMGDPLDPVKNPGSCPADCPAIADKGGVPPPADITCPSPKVSLVAVVSEECGARGSCDRSQGICRCRPGYTSSDCSLCAEGFSATNGECSLLPVAPLEPTVQDLSESPEADSRDDWALILLLGAIAGACLLIASLVVIVIIWRRNRRAESARGRASRKQFEAEFSPWHNIGAAQDIPETPHPATQQPKDDFTAAAPEEDDADDQVNAHEVSFDINQGEINAADLDASFESSLRGMVMMPSEQPAAGGIRSMVSLPFEHEQEETQPQMKAKQPAYPPDIADKLG